MTDKECKYLSDISFAIGLIGKFTEETSSFFNFETDLKTRSTVERQLAISSNQLLTNTGETVDFRNRIIHAYDAIETSIIWAIIKKVSSSIKKT